MGSVPNSRKEISMRYDIRWFKYKLKPPKNWTRGASLAPLGYANAEGRRCVSDDLVRDMSHTGSLGQSSRNCGNRPKRFSFVVIQEFYYGSYNCNIQTSGSKRFTRWLAWREECDG